MPLAGSRFDCTLARRYPEGVNPDAQRRLIPLFALLVLAQACGPKATNSEADTSQVALQVGEVMASIDEAGGNAYGSFASVERSFKRTVDRLETRSWLTSIIPSAWASSCAIEPYPACLNASITRNFNQCTILSTTLNGSVALKWTDTASATCRLNPVPSPSPGQVPSVTRKPDFTLTAANGAVFTIKLATGATYGQKISLISGTGAGATYLFRVMAFARPWSTMWASPVSISPPKPPLTWDSRDPFARAARSRAAPSESPTM